MRNWRFTEPRAVGVALFAALAAALVFAGCSRPDEGALELKARAREINSRLVPARNAALAIRDAAQNVFEHQARYDAPFKPGREYATYDGSLVYAKEADGKSSIIGTGATPVVGPTLAKMKRLEHLIPALMKETGAHSDVAMAWFATPESLGVFYPPYDMVALVPPRLDVTREILPYLRAVEGNPSNSPVWLEPYIDMTGKGYMVTVSVPLVSSDGAVLGVAGADVALEPLIKDVAGPSFNNRLLVSADSYVLAAGERAAKALGVESLGRVYYLRIIERDVPAPEKFRLDRSGDEKLAALGRRLKTFTGESTLPWGDKVLNLKAEKVPETGWLLVEVDLK